ncbi:hypothetical protein GQX73_g4356 [Xylaria multiplex]|uniref:Uncharacterized protein n=1 Tax=Xylaria multiplex TaxID=323545 RepID=A0A7C8IU94_9PEZI|nr:hypothetical protein GQX73_g4356 [Xylaria multiplex]
MAPLPLWPQSTSQQSKVQQEPPPASSPSPPLTTSSPSLSHAPAPSSNEPSKPKPKDAGYRGMPSSTELWQISAKSLQTGILTGGLGLLFGAGTGIIRSAPPTLFAVFAGLQWFTLGSSYMASRGLLCHAWGGEENLSSSDLVKVGGVAGGVSGMTGGMIRGPRNILPGMLCFGALGAGGSYLSQLFRGTEPRPKTSWLDSKWSPMQRLSDKDYMDKVEEKILRLDAEIAIIDENIASLKASSPSSTSSS